MISIPGRQGRCCDGPTRRELLRVGGAGMLGLSLPQFLARQALANASPSGTFGKAKSVILLYLQGGPSHIDLWDPKDGRAVEHSRRVQADQVERGRDLSERSHAVARPTDGQVLADPFGELYA